MSEKKSIIIAYVPVIHKGYLNFFRSIDGLKKILILPRDYSNKFRFLQKDLRALEPEEIVQSLNSLELGFVAEVLSLDNLAEQLEDTEEIFLPDEEVSRAFAQEFLVGKNHQFKSIFLRWDTQRSVATPDPLLDEELSVSDFDRKIMSLAARESGKSPDWWRQVGAVLIKDDLIVQVAYNHHLPLEQEAYQVGDPRANFGKGVEIDKSIALHAEAALISHAAKTGTAVEGASLYVTTFPCPTCAKLVAASGITKVYFRDGYSLVDGESVLKAFGVRIIRVR